MHKINTIVKSKLLQFFCEMQVLHHSMSDENAAIDSKAILD